MNKALLLSLTLTSGLCVAGFASADSELPGNVFVVHGINGTDLGEHEDLPVDIAVNGECTNLTEVTFQTISNPLKFEPGQYKIEVFLADDKNPCHGPLAITKKVPIQFGENVALVAHLTEQGTPTLSKFVNDLRPTEDGETRLIVRHTAAAPPVDVNGLEDIRNGQQRSVEVAPGEVEVTVEPFGEESIGPIPLPLEGDTSTIVYAVGSLKNGTFEPLPQILYLTY